MIILSEVTHVEQQILDALNQYVAENPGHKLNKKAIKQIHANAESFDHLVNDLHYQMKIHITMEKTCIVRFTTEQGALITTYTFYGAIVMDMETFTV